MFTRIAWRLPALIIIGLGLSLAGCESPKVSKDTSAGDDDDNDDDGNKKKKKKKKGNNNEGDTKKAKAGDGDDDDAPDSEGKAAASPSKPSDGFSQASVDAGEAPGGVWTPAFKARRVNGDTGKDYLEAAEHCRGQSLALCTETQWLRVCAAEPALGKLESWTASWDGTQPVLRGASSCDDRKKVAGSDKSTSRAAVCCERAIGIAGSNTSEAFRKAAHAEQLKYEKANNAKNIPGLKELWDTGLHFDGKWLTKDKAVKAQQSWFNQHPEQWVLYDVCDMSIGDIESPHAGRTLTVRGLIHDCRVVSVLGNKVTVVKQFIGRSKMDDDKNNKVSQIKHHSRTRKLAPL